MAVAALAKGLNAFLGNQLSGLLSGLNAAVAAELVSGSGPAPVFALVMGEPPTVTVPTLAFSHVSDAPTRTASNNKTRAVTFRIQCLIPQAGENSPVAFEVCRQAAADFVLDLFDDDAVMLTPAIKAGSLGTVRAVEAERADLVDIFPRKMEDQKTVVRGWQFLYTASFNVRTR